MDRFLPKEEEKESQISGKQTFLLFSLIPCVIIYALFLIFEFIDLIAEMVKKDDEFYYFYLLRLIFFGVSILIQVLYVILLIIYLIIVNKVENDEELQNKIMSTFGKLYSALFLVWTAFLLAAGIPRLIIFFSNREKIGKFIYSLIIIKILLLFPLYVFFIVNYVILNDNKKKKE